MRRYRISCFIADRYRSSIRFGVNLLHLSCSASQTSGSHSSTDCFEGRLSWSPFKWSGSCASWTMLQFVDEAELAEAVGHILWDKKDSFEAERRWNHFKKKGLVALKMFTSEPRLTFFDLTWQVILGHVNWLPVPILQLNTYKLELWRYQYLPFRRFSFELDNYNCIASRRNGSVSLLKFYIMATDDATKQPKQCKYIRVSDLVFLRMISYFIKGVSRRT